VSNVSGVVSKKSAASQKTSVVLEMASQEIPLTAVMAMASQETPLTAVMAMAGEICARIWLARSASQRRAAYGAQIVNCAVQHVGGFALHVVPTTPLG
jgi:hypothetical protein